MFHYGHPTADQFWILNNVCHENLFLQRHLVTQRGAIVAAMKMMAESRSQPAGQHRQESFQYAEQDRTLVSIDAHRQVSIHTDERDTDREWWERCFCKVAALLSFRYLRKVTHYFNSLPLLNLTTPIQILATAILNAIKSLLARTKSN